MSQLISRRSLLALFGIAACSIGSAGFVSSPSSAQPVLSPDPPVVPPPPASGTERRVERRIVRTERRQDRRIRRAERRAARREGRQERRALRREGRDIRRETRHGL
jgi:hypothetical protein